MKQNSILSKLLIGCLLTSGIFTMNTGGTVSAMTTPEEAPILEETAKSEKERLTEVTKKVKEQISIPSEYSEFSYYIYSGYSSSAKETISLSWSYPDSSRTIRINSDFSGRITEYALDKANQGTFTPKYKKDSLRLKADAFLKNTFPSLYESLSYQASDFLGSYWGEYQFSYRRTEHSIPMPEHTVTVNMNYDTGEVCSFRANWDYDVTIPPADTKFSEQDAAKLIEKNLTMDLSYQTLYKMDGGKNIAEKAYLVYSPDKSYLSVDAKTGAVYDSKSVQSENFSNQMKEDSAVGEGRSTAGLTQNEIDKIEEIAGILSKEKAINTIKGNKYLLLDKNLTETTARLYQNKDNPGKPSYAWSISFQSSKDYDFAKNGGTYAPYAYASLDAKTGQLISFNSSVSSDQAEDSWESSLKYTKEECRKIFETFTAETLPDYYKQTVYAEPENDYVIGYDKAQKPVYGGYRFQNNRVHQNIPYPDNSISAAIDTVTGKVYSFDYTWNDAISFEAPDKILSPKQAFAQYISKDGFDLIYEISALSGKNHVRLVYNTNINPRYISPFTGEQLNYDGSTYKPKDNYLYSDISDSDARESIGFLSDMGCGFSGGTFQPEKAITRAELLKFLEALNLAGGSQTDSFRNSADTLTRMEAAKLSIQLLHLEKAAKIENIYSITFLDSDKIAKPDMGFAALAAGFGLLKPNEENFFRPDGVLTRAEAANMVLSILYAK